MNAGVFSSIRRRGPNSERLRLGSAKAPRCKKLIAVRRRDFGERDPAPGVDCLAFVDLGLYIARPGRPTSDGKTTLLVGAASVTGLLGSDGLPGWADSEPALEALLRGHRDCLMALDDTGDGEHQMRLDKKVRMLAFQIARNRPRKLSKVYERNNGLEARETRNIVLSSSERALGQIARAAGKSRLGGEEVRFIDIPASDPGSAGIFDGNIVAAPGKTLRETTKEFVETLKANAIKHQGYCIRELLEKYLNDPHGLEHLRAYKEQFERDAVLPDRHNAHYRVRSNFALMYASEHGDANAAIDLVAAYHARRSA